MRSTTEAENLVIEHERDGLQEFDSDDEDVQVDLENIYSRSLTVSSSILGQNPMRSTTEAENLVIEHERDGLQEFDSDDEDVQVDLENIYSRSLTVSSSSLGQNPMRSTTETRNLVIENERDGLQEFDSDVFEKEEEEQKVNTTIDRFIDLGDIYGARKSIFVGGGGGHEDLVHKLSQKRNSLLSFPQKERFIEETPIENQEKIADYFNPIFGYNVNKNRK